MRIIDAHTTPSYSRMQSPSPPRGFAVAPRSPKRATNVSLRSDLLEAAREAGVNLSATLERALTEELARLKRRQWREEHAEAIAAYNEQFEKHGPFSARSF
jgi:antitoxin CcdA